MKRILRSRLPERFADRVPPLLMETVIAVAVTAVMTLFRIALVPLTGDRAPYALVFVAVVGATALAGWRSGLLAIILGQSLAWFLIVDPAGDAVQRALLIGGLSLATFAQLVAVVIITLYQREVEKAWSRQEAQVDLLQQALAEIDHRTVNNYQTVLALVLAQAKRADAPVKEALQQVADRIRAIAMASKQLSIGSESLEQVRTARHLGELCGELRQGLSRPGISLQCEFADVSLGADEITSLSIILNELVTNALKHAFPDGRQGEIRVSLRKAEHGLLLEVVDNGVGIKGSARTRGTGLGTRLVETFTKQLGARYEVETGDSGTRHRIHIPQAG